MSLRSRLRRRCRHARIPSPRTDARRRCVTAFGCVDALARHRSQRLVTCACGVRLRLGEYHSPIEDGDAFGGAKPQENVDGLCNNPVAISTELLQ